MRVSWGHTGEVDNNDGSARVDSCGVLPRSWGATAEVIQVDRVGACDIDMSQEGTPEQVS